MKRRRAQYVWGGIVMVVCLLGVLSCRRSDVRAARIHVPGMVSEKDIRIVTNAVNNEIAGRYDPRKNDYEIDLGRNIVLYHEGARLRSAGYQQVIQACLKEVGYEARFLSVMANPAPPIPTENGLFYPWNNRVSAAIEIRSMTSCMDANRVVAAIAYARLGGQHPGITIQLPERQVLVESYESIVLSQKNIEYAIAQSGYGANQVPPRLGGEDALPHGWTPVTIHTKRDREPVSLRYSGGI